MFDLITDNRRHLVNGATVREHFFFCHHKLQHESASLQCYGERTSKQNLTAKCNNHKFENVRRVATHVQTTGQARGALDYDCWCSAPRTTTLPGWA